MSNVVAFPIPAVEAPVRVRATGAKTLFIHIKCATLIAHLAAAAETSIAGGRVGKKS